MRYLLVIAIFVLALPGCDTPYQKSGLGGGYKDQKIDEHSYHLSYYGNSFISADEVISRWHRRAAELCGGAPKEIQFSDESKTVNTVTPAPSDVSVSHNIKKVDGVVVCN